MADPRDTPTWVVVELSRLGEMKAEDGTLEASLRRDLGVDSSFPVYVPVSLYKKDGKIIPLHLMQGYAFVASGLDDVVYFSLEKLPYVNQVVTTRQGPNRFRYLSVVSDSRIQELRDKMKELVTEDIPLNSRVSITEGSYKGLDGVVTGFHESDAYVNIVLRSIEIIATIPKVFLEPM